MIKYKTPEYREKHAKHARENRKKNKDLTRERMRRYREKNGAKYRETQRNADLKKHYGITTQEWDLIFSDQGRRCAICRTDSPGRSWHTDHCHTTRRVRGILCPPCNAMLGYAKDDTVVLKSAILYLRKGLLFQDPP